MKLFYLFVSLFCFTTTNYSQLTFENLVHNDTLNLTIKAIPNATYIWETSVDSIQWNVLNNENQHRLNYVVNTTLPNVFIRSKITENQCDSYYSKVIKIENKILTYYWTDTNAWENKKIPSLNEYITVKSDRKIIYNTNAPKLSGLRINGTLEFQENDLTLQTDYIMLHGELRIGTEKEPFKHKAILRFTATDTSQNIMGMGTRGLMVMGGALELHGNPPSTIYTAINNHLTKGSTEIELDKKVNWNPKDEIVISPTDYYLAGNGSSETQKTTINQINGAKLNVLDPSNAFRWGLLQYATANGLSLTNSDVITPPIIDSDTAKTPLILDERARVGNLTRNIIIEAPNDSLWKNLGFGVQVMIMETESQAHVNGVEIRRGGQRGKLGRYPFHWHMLSYEGTQTLQDAVGHYFTNSVINESANRGIVIHGTNGVTVSKNIVYDVKGHGIFTENAVERRNRIDSNLVLKVRNAIDGFALKQHEIGERGASGFWISNPDNTVTNNVAADCETNGFWLAFPAKPFGPSANVLGENGKVLNPSRILFGKFDKNIAHSNRNVGIMLDLSEFDEAGNTRELQYCSTTDGQEPSWPETTVRSFKLTNYSVWKNGANGIWDRGRKPQNYGVVSADNCGRFFAGSGDDGLVERSLVIGTSLNFQMNGTGRPAEADFSATRTSSNPVAFATYHSSFDIRNNIVMHFTAAKNVRSGMFSTDDYYIRPVDRGQLRNKNNLQIDAHPGVKLTAPFNYFCLASALWDPYGVWGPDSNYFVYDVPFLTHGKTIHTVAPSTDISGGVSVSGPFYGFEGFVLHGVGDTPPKNQPYMDLMAIHVSRKDTAMQEVATWDVQGAQQNMLLQHMRHFATDPTSIYELTFPDDSIHPTNFQMNVENMLTENDTQVMGIQYDGTLSPIVIFQSPGAYRVYTAVNSLQEVRQSAGETFWQDKINNRVWVKMKGGYWKFWTQNPNEAVPSNDDKLYNTTKLRIFVP